MEYNFREVEEKWQRYWREHQTYKTTPDQAKKKYYVLDMFPYPSGAGLHVGHPLGYIASDIFSRYKKLKGFNVLHPMGYDAFGLPAEQYAIQTGQHPAVTTAQNIKRYREQLDKIGFGFDWDREVRTSDPGYYKWTQWILEQLFSSWYNEESGKAESIDVLIHRFEKEGNSAVKAAGDETPVFSADEWNNFSENKKQEILLSYRLAYLADSWVNWCPALGTVLANEEVKDGLSERGGHPVERKQMKQWSLRITAYANRLLEGLDTIDWPDSIKEAQRNWIGRSQGAMVTFKLAGIDEVIEVFTTRPDTIYGVSFLTLAPEHDLVPLITTKEQKKEVEDYVAYARNRSERERMSEVKKISGVFTGGYVLHPFTNDKIPVWIGDYVLAGYGTGAVMAVPAGDQRDWDFAKHFNIPIPPIVTDADISTAADPTKEGIMMNSHFLNGLTGHEAIPRAIVELEKNKSGKGKINYRLRDAIFSRQRYWGEPFPVYYKDGLPYLVAEADLPVELPEVDKYLPTEDGEPPLARAKNWSYSPDGKNNYPLETSTMPGWAGSSWYYLRYMDAHNNDRFVSEEAVNYWQDVDLYIGGAEHATGHLLYVRFWTKFLYDLGYIPKDEPAKKLINQGMIQGVSSFVYRINGTNKFVSLNLKEQYETTALHVDISMVKNNELDTTAFVNSRSEYKDAEFITENGKYICGSEVEKMSKSKWNVVSPDDIINDYGADCLRMYEMFLGPLEQSKPWNTNGISGVSNFIRKLWRLFHKENKFFVSDDAPSPAELKSLHKTIRKAEEDIERFSFNTSVSTFMICINELTDLKCNKRSILEPLLIVLSPYAPHVTEELWSLLGNKESITNAVFPAWKEEYLKEDSYEYPVSINGKVRFKMQLSLSLSPAEVEQRVLGFEDMHKFLNGDKPKKVIVVPGRIVNIVL